MKKQILTILIIAVAFLGCNNTDKIANEINKIEINLQIARFDQEFTLMKPGDITRLRTKYPYLFPAPDSIWIAKLKDSLQIELRNEVTLKFEDFDEETQNLEQLFKHIKYYFPKFKLPKVITVTNDVDYQHPVILADSLLFIGLDNYLGPKHRFYQDFQKYIALKLDKQFLINDVAGAFIDKMMVLPRDRTLLARMIYYGKQLYIKDKLIPFISDARKIGYTQEQMTWAVINEEPIWRNFIEEEHLYSTDSKLGLRFLESAPFSKFGLALDNESPGQIGRYIGWQIVRAFMDNNTVSIKQLLDLPAEEIFKKSNYKPKK